MAACAGGKSRQIESGVFVGLPQLVWMSASIRLSEIERRLLNR